MELSTTSAIILAGLTAIALYIPLRTQRPAGSKLPGPRPLPLIGNLLQIPTERAWETLARWTKDYGELYQFHALGQNFVVMGSPKVVNELFQKRSHIYSDRPPMTFGKMAGFDKTFVMCNYGPRLREFRKYNALLLGTRNVPEIRLVQMQKSRKFLAKLLSTPREFQSHCLFIMSSIILELSHGHEVKDVKDGLVRMSEEAIRALGLAAVPGTWMVDMIPALRYVPDWFPGTQWKAAAKRLYDVVQRTVEEPYAKVKQDLANGTARPSFVAKLLELGNPTPEQEEIFKYLTFGLYAGGNDSSAATLSLFFFVMTLFPDIQRKAQDQLDAVLKARSGSLPDFSDRPNLPYLEAVILEIYRWNPAIPVYMHRLMQDDVYEGYHIPEGAMVFVNSWGLAHDDTLYPDPWTFNPERFLSNKDSSLNLNPRTFVFGGGRRICPGMQLADDSMFILFAMTLAAFNISPPIGGDGEPMMPNVEFSIGLISRPSEFMCEITPRSDEIARLVSTFEEA